LPFVVERHSQSGNNKAGRLTGPGKKFVGSKEWKRGMIITDRYEHVIDDKGRLAIPSQIRNVMDPQVDGTAFYLVSEGRYLQLIPEKLFERLALLSPTGLMPAPEAAKVRRFIFSNASRLEPDKQGRVMIPDRYMADSKHRDPITPGILGRDVMLVGVGERLELWNRADYIAHMRELMQDRLSFQSTLDKTYGSVPVTTAAPQASSSSAAPGNGN
jgi:MraZ protein